MCWLVLTFVRRAKKERPLQVEGNLRMITFESESERWKQNNPNEQTQRGPGDNNTKMNDQYQ